MLAEAVLPVSQPFGAESVIVEVKRPKQRPKLPICFVIKHNSGHSYQVWYFEELDLLVKVSPNEENGEFQPAYDGFKPISREVFEKILNSEVFEVV